MAVSIANQTSIIWIYTSKFKAMSETDRELLIRGLEKAEYNTLRMKAMRNEMVLKDDADGNIIRVPARDVFVQLYHEAVPTF